MHCRSNPRKPALVRHFLVVLGLVSSLATAAPEYDLARLEALALESSRALLASRPSMDPENRRTEPPLTGDPPNPVNPPSGCRFRTRCPMAEDVCAQILPPEATLSPGHEAACLMSMPGSGHTQAPRAAA